MASKRLLAAVVLACAALAGCTTTPEQDANNDPFEPLNRVVFNANHFVNRYVGVPVGEVYTTIVPKPARHGIHNALINLSLPVTFANDLLQGSPKRAAQTLYRFSVNSTLGLGGMFDLASDWGVPAHTEDLGQTLGVYGVPEGPYMVVPLIGPAPPRDLIGHFGDSYLDPLFYMDFSARHGLLVARHLSGLVDQTSGMIDQIKHLDNSSADPYAATRSAYRQHRNSEIRNGAPDANLPEITPELILDKRRD